MTDRTDAAGNGGSNQAATAATPLIEREFLYPLFVFLAVAFPLIFLGYGADNDSYGVLDAGVRTWLQANPYMSRHPGYWLYEALTLILSQLGSYVATNGVTLLLAAVVLWRCFHILRRQQVAHAGLWLLCLALNPWFIVAATTTMDYMWSLVCVVLCSDFFMQQRYPKAGIWGGLAASLRLGSVYALAGIFLGHLLQQPSLQRFRALVVAGVVLLCITSAHYMASWFEVDGNFSFLSAHMDGGSLWSLKMHAGRFLYKSVYLYGLLSAPVLAWIIVQGFITRTFEFKLSGWSAMALGGSVGTMLMFAQYPIETPYLLPFLCFFYLLLALQLRQVSKNSLWLLLATTVSYSLVSFPLAEPNHVGQASDATIGLRVTDGVLLADIKQRWLLRGCGTQGCHIERTLPSPQ